MKKYIYLFFMLLTLVSCEKPEEDVMPSPSINADIVRFRIYRNANMFYDGIIDKSTSEITVAVPSGIDKTAIRPQVLVSNGATVVPASGEQQDFTRDVTYTVTSENGENVKIYTVTVVNE